MKENYDFSQGKKGVVIPQSSHQTKLTILIDNDILEWFGDQVEQAEGGDYLTLINEALRDYMQDKNREAQETQKATHELLSIPNFEDELKQAETEAKTGKAVSFESIHRQR